MDPTPPPPPPSSTTQSPPEHQQPPTPTPPITSQPPLTTTTAAAAAITPTTTTSAAAALPPPTTTSSSSLLPATTSPSLPSSSNPDHYPNAAVTSSQPSHQPTTTTLSTNPQTRPTYNRPWQQQPSPFSHYSLPPPPLPTVTTNSSSSPSLSVPPHPPRGGMAIGVPAHHPATPPTLPTAFSSLNRPSFGQPFMGLGRNVTDTGAASSSSQVRQPIGGMQGIGMIGSLGSSSAMRPPGIPGHPMRPVQHRPQPSPSAHSPAAQNFQGHGMLRVPSVGSPGSPSPNSTQSPNPQNQPWLSSGPQGKHPLSAASLRPQLTSQSMAQRSHITQQHHHSISAPSHQQHASAAPQSQASGSPQEPYGQQFPQSRTQQPLLSQQHIARPQGSGIQRPQAMMPSPAAQAGAPGRTASAEPEEPCKRILSKRSIQELIAQVDPSEKLDPEVEDILVDIADDFVESITSFGCSLAKHRKSNTLEAKDVLLHLERNWNITLPGFGGDEIKTYKKPPSSDIHKERLATIKKSVAAEVTNSKSSAGQTGGNPKSHLAKGPTSFVGSPAPRLREPA